MKRQISQLAAINVIFLTSIALAQPPRVSTLTESFRRGNLTAKQVIDLLDLHQRLGVTPANRAFDDQLMWWWAADQKLSADKAMEQLISAYRQAHGDVPAEFRDRVKRTLVELPAPGNGVYFPPSYVVRAPMTLRPFPFVLGRPKLGPNEKSAISQISAGTQVRGVIRIP